MFNLIKMNIKERGKNYLISYILIIFIMLLSNKLADSSDIYNKYIPIKISTIMCSYMLGNAAYEGKKMEDCFCLTNVLKISIKYFIIGLGIIIFSTIVLKVIQAITGLSLVAMFL